LLAYAISHVGRYRSASSTDFEAPPAWHYSYDVEMSPSDRITNFFERGEPVRASLTFIAEDIR
jgi:hypothetical protein